MYARYIYGFILLTKTSDDWAHAMIASIRDMTLLPTKYHISVQGGEKIKLIDRSSEAVWETSDILFLDILPYFLLSCILIVIGFFIHVSLTLIALIFLPVSILITRHFGERAHTQQREVDTLWDKLF
jgi:ABC-type multidrug transport system fused ATPase/permease subunit